MKKETTRTDVTGRALLSPDEFARAIGVSHWTVRNHVKAGKVASVRVGALIKIPAEEVEKVKRGSLAPQEK